MRERTQFSRRDFLRGMAAARSHWRRSARPGRPPPRRLSLMLTQCIRRYADTRHALAPLRRERERVRRVRAYPHDNYAENVTLAELADLAHVSPYHLHRLFCQEVGIAPHRYQTQVRVDRAKTLLAQGLPISQVAVETGFADQSHLTRHFKRLVHVTPGRYRVHKSKNVQDGTH